MGQREVKAKHPTLVSGIVLVLMVMVLAVVSYFYTPHDPNAMTIVDRHQSPSAKYLLGTDHFGRDILSRIMVGSQAALYVGALSTLLAAVVGVSVGAWAGYYGGWYDELTMRFMDGIYAFPSILFAVMIIAVMGPGLGNTTLAIGIGGIPVFARITRANVLALKERDYVEAARSLGASESRILWRHIMPNASGAILVQCSINFATAVLAEAGLSYLGLGTQPPDPSWGRMLRDAQSFAVSAPWTALAPGLAIVILVIGFNLLGDGLRDALDPNR